MRFRVFLASAMSVYRQVYESSVKSTILLELPFKSRYTAVAPLDGNG